MEILHALYRNVRTIAMPSGMVIGALLCRPIAALDAWSHHTVTPALIFMMLFITFCRVEPRRMHLEPLHGWLLLFQVVVSLGVYFLLEPLNVIVAQGAMICVLAPIAMAAVVIGGMLGGSITTMATYSLLCNMAIAVIAPAVLSVVGNGECSSLEIFRRIVPLLVGPFLAAQLLRAVLPKIAEWIGAHGQISFYMWLASLTIIIGRTMVFIMEYPDTDIYVEAAMAVAAGAICVLQFVVGRRLGRRYGDAVAGGQSLGQKNTVLAIWMAQSFMNPLSSIAPTAYIIWQNLVNSYQIYRKDKEAAETRK